MRKIKIWLALFLLITMFLSGPAHKIYADPPQPSASFAMSGATLAPGATFAVAVYENSGSNSVNGVTANITYDPTQLQFVSADFSSSDFSNHLQPTDNGTVVSINTFTFIPVTNNASVVIANFKNIGSQSSTSLSFASSSKIASGGSDIWDKNPTTTNFNFVTPAAPTAATTTTPTDTTTEPQQTTKPVTAIAQSTNYKAVVPIDSVLGSANNSYKARTRFPVDKVDNTNWLLFIGLCVTASIGLATRLINIRRKIPVTALDKMLVSSLDDGLTSKNLKQKKIPVTVLDKMVISSLDDGLTSKKYRHKLKAAKR